MPDPTLILLAIALPIVGALHAAFAGPRPAAATRTGGGRIAGAYAALAAVIAWWQWAPTAGSTFSVGDLATGALSGAGTDTLPLATLRWLSVGSVQFDLAIAFDGITVLLLPIVATAAVLIAIVSPHVGCRPVSFGVLVGSALALTAAGSLATAIAAATANGVALALFARPSTHSARNAHSVRSATSARSVRGGPVTLNLAVHTVAIACLLLGGVLLLAQTDGRGSTAGSVLLLIAILLRCGAWPLHHWAQPEDGEPAGAGLTFGVVCAGPLLALRVAPMLDAGISDSLAIAAAFTALVLGVAAVTRRADSHLPTYVAPVVACLLVYLACTSSTPTALVAFAVLATAVTTWATSAPARSRGAVDDSPLPMLAALAASLVLVGVVGFGGAPSPVEAIAEPIVGATAGSGPLAGVLAVLAWITLGVALGRALVVRVARFVVHQPAQDETATVMTHRVASAIGLTLLVILTTAAATDTTLAAQSRHFARAPELPALALITICLNYLALSYAHRRTRPQPTSGHGEPDRPRAWARLFAAEPGTRVAESKPRRAKRARPALTPEFALRQLATAIVGTLTLLAVLAMMMEANTLRVALGDPVAVQAAQARAALAPKPIASDSDSDADGGADGDNATATPGALVVTDRARLLGSAVTREPADGATPDTAAHVQRAYPTAFAFALSLLLWPVAGALGVYLAGRVRHPARLPALPRLIDAGLGIPALLQSIARAGAELTTSVARFDRAHVGAIGPTVGATLTRFAAHVGRIDGSFGRRVTAWAARAIGADRDSVAPEPAATDATESTDMRARHALAGAQATAIVILSAIVAIAALALLLVGATSAR